MSDGGVEKIDLEKVDWRGSREFFESLGEALDKLDDKDEAYDFTWVGKRKAVIEAGAPINKTFRPDVENSKNWDTTENLFIEGDNLDALKLLQESYLGKVKMIYIDPPYNTGKDFVYRDNFKASVENYDEDTEYKDEQGNIQFKKNEKSNGRYHSDWLSMMYPRLKLARNLLREDGLIFISINDIELANLSKVCDEVFGEDNFVTNFIWQKKKKPSFLDNNVGSMTEYVVCYSKVKQMTIPFSIDSTTEGKKYPLNNAGNSVKTLTFPAGSVKFTQISGRVSPQDMSEGNIITKLLDEINIVNGFNEHDFHLEGEWRYSQQKLNEIVTNKETILISKVPFRPNHVKAGGEIKKMHNLLSQFTYKTPTNEDGSAEIVKLLGSDLFDHPKPTGLIKTFIKCVTYDSFDGIVVDFFSGSGTTANAVMQLNAEDGGNRKWIMVQLPEETDEKSEAFKAGYKTIPEISRERIRRAGDKIAEQHPDAKVDYGFRALTITDTNYKDVFKPAVDYQQSTLLDTVDNIKDDRSELDLLFGILTQSAFELNKPLETRDIAGSNVFLYDYFGEVSGLVACFADTVSEETIKQIAQLKPLTAVFRDSSFASSQAKVNLSEHFRILSSDTKVKVI
jgi:adenine-specific DNA-methyltransferase